MVGYTSGPLLMEGSSSGVQLIAGQSLGVLAALAVASMAGMPVLGRTGRRENSTARRFTVGLAFGAAAGTTAFAALLAVEPTVGTASILVTPSTLLALTLGAALSEEIVFRHIVYRSLRYSHSHWAAGAASAAIFVAAHSTQGVNIYSAVTVAVAGLALAHLYRTHGLTGAVAFHGSFNLTVILGSMIAFG